MIGGVAVSIIVGYWIERYTWIAGAGSDTPLAMFSPFGIAVSLVVFAAAFLLVRGAMKKYGLIT